MKFLSEINVNREFVLPIADGTNGQVITTDGQGNAYWGSISIGALNLDGLQDVVITTPTSGQILRYGIPVGSEDLNPVWYNWSPNYLTFASSIDALSDVAITSATTGQILQWNGSAWINWTPNYLTAHPAIPNSGSVNNSLGTVVQDITVDANGHVTAIGSVDLDARYDVRYYTQEYIDGFFGGDFPIAGYNLVDWDTAFSWGNHASAGYATTSYVTTAIANLVAAAPATLDTLNELAAALGDDPNFATTVTNSIATKVPTTRTLTINGTAFDLSADRSWTISSADGYISDVRLQESTLEFAGQGSAFTGNIDLSTLPFASSSHNHDDRYYTETESDSRFVNATGDSMSGNLTLSGYANPHINISSSGGSYSYLQLSDASSNGYIIKNITGGTGNNALPGALYTYTDSNNAFQHLHAGVPLFTILSGGNVGIGTTGPNAPLHIVKDTEGADAVLRLRGTNTTARTTRLQFEDYNGTIADGLIDFIIPTAGSSTGARLSLGVGSETISIINGGNVGIGTTNPDAKFDVRGAAKFRGSLNGVTIAPTATGGNIYVYESDAPKVYIESAGHTIFNTGYNFGIGTTSPEYKLDVNGTGRFSGQLRTTQGGRTLFLGDGAYANHINVDSNVDFAFNYNNGNTGGFGFFAGGTVAKFFVSNSGVITAFEGNSTNWNAAYSWGNHATAGYFKLEGTEPITIQAETVTFTGNVTVEGTFTESSSIRFKENITPLDPALDKVNELEAVSYNKIGEDDREIGLIAEDVAELFPEVVTYNEEGQPQGIQYQRLSVILLKAVQELTERVNKLENK